MSVPILMITYNRIEYTKIALEALLNCSGALVYVIDNGSTDGTSEWLSNWFGPNKELRPIIFHMGENVGIGGAMNVFLKATRMYEIVGKVDNDTVVDSDWLDRMMKYMKYADIIQSRHKIIPATCPGGWDEFVKPMRKSNGIYYNHYVGGSGILFRRNPETRLPFTDNKIMAWREYQKQNPKLLKAFIPDVEIKLLDEDGYPEEYREYYKQTGRI